MKNDTFGIENGVLKKYNGDSPAVIIPNGVEIIGHDAFRGRKDITYVKLPEGVTTICSYAFGYCSNLKNVSTPSTLKVIEEKAFTYCVKLEKIFIPKSVTNIGLFAFARCECLEKAFIPSEAEEAYPDSFWGCFNITVFYKRHPYRPYQFKALSKALGNLQKDIEYLPILY